MRRRLALWLVWAALLHLIPCSTAQARPLIGITTAHHTLGTRHRDRFYTHVDYVEAVTRAGGTPLLLPAVAEPRCLDEYLHLMDGLLLTGGRDVPPSAYGEDAHPSVIPMTGLRFGFERILISRWIRETRKPVLGICLGMQFANVVLGGSLVQDIPTGPEGRLSHRSAGGAVHSVRIRRDSRLYSILEQDPITVNSSHHQAVDRLGKGLIPVARSADDIVEALEFPGSRFGVFVQWHPERSGGDAHGTAIFRAFLDAVSAHQARRVRAGTPSQPADPQPAGRFTFPGPCPRQEDGPQLRR